MTSDTLREKEPNLRLPSLYMQLLCCHEIQCELFFKKKTAIHPTQFPANGVATVLFFWSLCCYVVLKFQSFCFKPALVFVIVCLHAAR